MFIGICLPLHLALFLSCLFLFFFIRVQEFKPGISKGMSFPTSHLRIRFIGKYVCTYKEVHVLVHNNEYSKIRMKNRNKGKYFKIQYKIEICTKIYEKIFKTIMKEYIYVKVCTAYKCEHCKCNAKMCTQAQDSQDLAAWLQHEYKCLGHDTQNKILRMQAHGCVLEIAKKVNHNQ